MKSQFDTLVKGEGWVDGSHEYKSAAIVVADTAYIMRVWLTDMGYEPDISTVLKMTEMVLSVRKGHDKKSK